MVRIFFNDTAGTDGIQVDLDNKENKKFEMSLDQFTQRVTASLGAYQFNDVRATCKNEGFAYNQTFYNATTWREEMTVLYPKIKNSAMSYYLSSVLAMVTVFGTFLFF